jgi:hypothetical protein
MTMFKRGCVILIIMWTSACGEKEASVTSPSTSALSSASTTTPGGPVLTTYRARVTRGIHPEDGASITFHIQDDRGAPIAGALLKATSNDVGPWAGLTNGAGDFNAFLFAGNYTLTVTAAGFDPRTIPANLAASGTVTIGLTRGVIVDPTKPGLVLTGKVTDGTSGGILPNIPLTLSGGQSQTTTTDGNGNYQFVGLQAGNYTVTASLVGYVSNSPSISLAPGNTVLNLVLQRDSGPRPLTGSIDIQGPTCTAGKSCTYVGSASGGQPPYRFDWTFSGNGASYPDSGMQVTPTLGCNFLNGSPTTPLSISLLITPSSGSPIVVTRSTSLAKAGSPCS